VTAVGLMVDGSVELGMIFLSSGSFCRPGRIVVKIRSPKTASSARHHFPSRSTRSSFWASDGPTNSRRAKPRKASSEVSLSRSTPKLRSPVPSSLAASRKLSRSKLRTSARPCAVLSMPSTCLPTESTSLPAPSPRSLNGWTHGFHIAMSASRVVVLTTPLTSLASSVATMLTAASMARRAVPIRTATRPASAAVKLAVLASVMDSLAILAMSAVCFSIAVTMGLTRATSASMSALSWSNFVLLLADTPSESELIREPVSLNVVDEARPSRVARRRSRTGGTRWRHPS